MFIQLLLALNAGPSHCVELGVPAHPKKKSAKVRIANAINIFSHLLIAVLKYEQIYVPFRNLIIES